MTAERESYREDHQPLPPPEEKDELEWGEKSPRASMIIRDHLLALGVPKELCSKVSALNTRGYPEFSYDGNETWTFEIDELSGDWNPRLSDPNSFFLSGDPELSFSYFLMREGNDIVVVAKGGRDSYSEHRQVLLKLPG